MRCRAAHFALASALLAGGCHHRIDLEPMPAMRPHCWWTSQYVAVAPVWLASRFEGALAANGYPNARMRRDGDSAWATSDPRPGISSTRPAYSFRVVAYSANDSAACAWRGTADAPVSRKPAGAQACFHANALIYRPADGWTPADSDAAGSRTIAMCSELYREAIGDLVKLK